MNSKTIPAFVSMATLLILGAATPQAHGQDRPEKELGGKESYQLFCVLCHGPRGQGSPLGKPLNAGDAVALTDDQIMQVIAKGRPDKGMMAFDTGLRPSEIRAVAMYVRELQGRKLRTVERRAEGQEAESAGTVADVKRGEALFNGAAKCIECHSYYTRGGVIGPALNAYGSRLSEAELLQAVVSPSETIAEGYAGKELVLKDGSVVRGRFRYETDSTVQILGENGALWTTYFKSDALSVKDLETSLMPHGLLDSLSEADQNALIAFLVSLK